MPPRKRAKKEAAAAIAELPDPAGLTQWDELRDAAATASGSNETIAAQVERWKAFTDIRDPILNRINVVMQWYIGRVKDDERIPWEIIEAVEDLRSGRNVNAALFTRLATAIEEDQSVQTVQRDLTLAGNGKGFAPDPRRYVLLYVA